MTAPLNSCIYSGTVRHRRFEPVTNEFTYGLYMVYLDLEELARVFKGRMLWSTSRPNLAWLKRTDHFGDPQESLDHCVRHAVEVQTGVRPAGPIRLLTHLRYFGYCFNPVSFFYCFDEAGERVETIVAEVSNTPWKERHLYILNQSLNQAHGDRMRFHFGKDFHVSPFMQMEIDYDWRFGTPRQDLYVHMDNMTEGRKVFDATMLLKRREINTSNLAWALTRYPAMTGQVIGKIYWQALKLWWKGSRYHPHPRSLQEHKTTS